MADARETDWRPRGWVGTWGLEEIAGAHAVVARRRRRERDRPPPPPPRPGHLAVAKPPQTAPIVYHDQPPETRSELEQIETNYRLLRDCAVAPSEVWAIFEAFAGPADCSPFSCPWSHLRPRVCHDGHDADGFDTRTWSGTAFVHGPRGQPGRVIELCSRYGQRRVVAALVKYQGDRWFFRHGASASIVLELGRVPLEPPPGVPANRPNNASVGLVWLPHGPQTAAARQVIDGGAFRFEAAIAGAEVEVIARRGVPPDRRDLGLVPGRRQLSLAV